MPREQPHGIPAAWHLVFPNPYEDLQGAKLSLWSLESKQNWWEHLSTHILMAQLNTEIFGVSNNYWRANSCTCPFTAGIRVWGAERRGWVVPLELLVRNCSRDRAREGILDPEMSQHKQGWEEAQQDRAATGFPFSCPALFIPVFTTAVSGLSSLAGVDQLAEESVIFVHKCPTWALVGSSPLSLFCWLASAENLHNLKYGIQLF